jgi:hypothetical protein
MALLEQYCPVRPVTTIYHMHDGAHGEATNTSQPATGCFQYKNDHVLEDLVSDIIDPVTGKIASYLKGRLNVWKQEHNSDLNWAPFFTNCINRCSMFQNGPPTLKHGSWKAPATKWQQKDGKYGQYLFTKSKHHSERFVPATDYSIGFLRAVDATNLMPKTDYCFCIPNPLLSRFFIEPVEMCTIKKHKASYNGSETCLGGDETKANSSTAHVAYSDNVIKSLSVADTRDIMPWTLRQVEQSNINGGKMTNVIKNPSCGFAINKENTKNFYMSVYRPRNFERSYFQCPEADNSRRLKAEHVEASPAAAEATPPHFNAIEAALNYSWLNGSSRCDHIGRVFKVVNASNISTSWLEKIDFQECVTLRTYGESFANFLTLPDLPRDLFYNWQRKWLLLTDLFYSSVVTTSWLLNSRSNDIYTIFDESLMHPKLFKSIFRKFSDFIPPAYESDAYTSHLEDVFPRSNFNMSENVSDIAVDLRQDALFAFTHISQQLYSRNISLEWEDFVEGIGHIHRNIMQYNPEARQQLSVVSGLPIHLRRRQRNGNEVGIRLGFSTYIHEENLGDHNYTQYCDTFVKQQSPCTQCAIVDNLLLETQQSMRAMTSYYEDSFEKIFDDFSDIFEITLEPFQGGKTHDAKRLREIHHLQKRHVLKQRKLSAFAISSTVSPSSSNTAHSDDIESVEDFARYTYLFLHTTDSAYVPFYEHGFSHYLNAFLDDSCDYENIIYKSAIPSGRVEWGILMLFISVLVLGTITIRFPVISIPLWTWPIILSLGYIIYVYEYYNPLCLPLIPHTVIDDLSTVFDNFIKKSSCICQYLPTLSNSTCSDTCTEFAIRDYNECSAVLDDVGFEELSIFWTSTLFVHLYLPSFLPTVFGVWPLSYIPVLIPSIQRIMYLHWFNIPTSYVECLFVNSLDIFASFTILIVSIVLLYITLANAAAFSGFVTDFLFRVYNLLLAAMVVIRTARLPIEFQLAVIIVILSVISAVFSPLLLILLLIILLPILFWLARKACKRHVDSSRVNKD